MRGELKSKGILLVETSVLISFLKIQRLDLLALLDREIVITEEVDAEIRGDKYPFQREHLQAHLDGGTLSISKIELTETLVLKAKFRKMGAFGKGECSTASKALELDCPCAMTDLDAIKRFNTLYPLLKVMTTTDIFRELLSENRLAVKDADLILPSWKLEAQNPIPSISSSFSEILNIMPDHGKGRLG